MASRAAMVRAGSWAPLLLAAALGTACAGPQSTMTPAGPAAGYVAGLTWFLVATLGLVYVAVLALLAVAARRGRRPAAAPAAAGDRRALAAIVIGGAVVPTLTGGALLGATLVGMGTVLPGPARDDLVIEVTGHQWWWEIRYPAADPAAAVTTANELHIPAGRRVRLRLTARDVIHSFWVPGLQGKMDMIPGRTAELALKADRPGRHRGQCAEYCGLQHARMVLWVVVDTPEDFAAWLASERLPAAEPREAGPRRGREVFLQHGCPGCHAVRGTSVGVGGPDLTHLAGRRTLAAGTLDNVPGNLAGWVVDPQAHKPGSRMPPTPLAAPDLHALVDYLAALR